ncbi:MAG: chromosomal replication initiator DnaA [Hyphomonas sp.]|uniref:helix-turn-helix domain-containing protein n=1 Tax=Hyphomonas sp. TaxID=87 RepID=UPI00178D4454|nr:helix-turn-helix domain-containing protein [Hyphomonas sp.]MBA3067729.1 chromosomal replication initiator DnaA [Hyphomonas sp.]MBU3921981.1 chromosomal replication initiator DnaA [Alphaproteobacteria bacterium]MBU4062183.1 chromosomal replication initiator DnaA [Alphaproteobacteria bacterium]MBU4165618.1 chromosomal replication initiator DnaA [Alphaproteobacteria bacterium]
MDEFNPRRDEDRAYLAAALVGFALGLKTQKILTGDRGSPVHARARHIAMHLAYAGLGMSLSRVAGGFGRDRSTAARACRLVEDYREDPDFDTWVDQLALGLRSVAACAPGEAVT